MALSFNRILVLITFILFFSKSGYSQNEFQEALVVYENDDLNKAVELFTNIINSKKDVAKALMYRSDCLINLGKAVEAKKDLEQSLKLDPSTPKIHYFYGRYYIFNKEPEKALESFSEEIKHNDKDNQSFDGRAIAKVQLKDFKGAIIDEDHAISLYPTDHTFYNNRGFAKIQLELLNEALEDFKLSLKVNPNSKAYANIGLVYIKMKLYSIAIYNFSQALVLKPTDPEILFYRGQCYEILNKLEDACNDCNKSKIICNQLKYEIPNLDELIKRLNCF